MPVERSRVGVAREPAGAAPPLLASRLAPAAPPEPVLLRPRLLARLDDATAGAVTVVTAPAGWGKTTLLASWARAAADDRAPAWVSVEVGDTGERFWAYLAAALRAAVTEADEVAPVPDRPPRPDQLELLAAALAARDRPVLLVLDDLHRITDPAALTGLEFLLRHAEQRLRLVAGARTDLPLPLHRFRLAGELTELGPAELAFTDDEVADLLTAHGVALPAASVRRLRERTGGWPAGLRLAALALRDRPDPGGWVERFGGDQPEVTGYLRQEVLAGWGDQARELLARTAVADAVCADLADALTGRADAASVLAGLARDGGFLHRDDSSPPWYRCHPLLADLFRAELGRLPADELRDLHERAAGWYAGNGRPAQALRHTLAAGRWDEATELFVARWPDLVPYDREDAAAPPPAAPPDEAVRRDPELGLAAAAERAYAGDPVTAADRLREAVARAATLAAPRRDRFRRLATALELTLARSAGDPTEVRGAAERLLATRTEPGPADDPRAGTAEDADVRAVAGTALGLVALDEGDLPAAAAAFEDALAAARTAGRQRTELVCASRQALLAAVRGELRAAERTAREALAMPPCRGWSCRTDCAHAHLALALVAVHRDEPEEAAAQLAVVGPAETEPTGAGLAALCRARLRRDAGDLAAAHRLLVAARDRLGHRQAAGQLGHWLLAAEADLGSARGDPAGARALLADRVRAADPPDPALGVALARAELRAGDPRAAGYALPAWDAPPAGDWPLPVRLDAGLLEAVLARRGGDDRRAGRILERVLALAGPEGFRRLFTRADEEVRDLLAAHLDTGTAHWSTVSDLVRSADEHSGDVPDRPVGDRPAGGGGPALDEPLTERELTILRYLQSILSNVEIAAELSLSVNTVKTHVRNIYRKLSATRRRDAVRRARELRLI
ncbi:LuxR family transcriptional regulator, maltose regulon positive regulatory protein [Micromonospora siamensis]|uniref:LuxR family transcriptional regulator, maltose regulon positive regulatory protein n=1 Tax=Micromonospora siamensis TaxID=299152 RepID=A0A1C5JQF8_9ACTN|nr:LuxR C-terminal-related transcriptional regulator [Micromonospora siamensis]SCG72810.1 LuxR family transcriptional regulator, maltose regulon positive regulatory protein [Micromonospora siamensis]